MTYGVAIGFIQHGEQSFFTMYFLTSIYIIIMLEERGSINGLMLILPKKGVAKKFFTWKNMLKKTVRKMVELIRDAILQCSWLSTIKKSSQP